MNKDNLKKISDIPSLVAEWDYELNGENRPEDFTCGSQYLAHWICSKGHKYTSKIVNRSSSKLGCPICSGRIIVSGINDLATLNPQLASEWDAVKNDISVDSVSPNSHAYAYWKCKQCNYEWKAQIKSRNKGNGCPICGKKKAALSKATPQKGQSFADLYPDLLKQWDYQKNKDINPWKINPGSRKRVFWICRNGHSWEAMVSKRTRRNQGCPFCYNASKTSFPEQVIFYYISKHFNAINRDKSTGYEFDIMIPDKNIAVEYDGSYWHNSDFSRKMEERKNDYCKNNGIILFRIKELNEEFEDKTCYIEDNVIYYKYDSEYLFLNDAIEKLVFLIEDSLSEKTGIIVDIQKDKNDIVSNYEHMEYASSLIKYSNLVNEWDYDKNGSLKPQNFKPGSEQKVFWICPQGHSYKSRISHRVNGVGCPICSNKKVLKGYNDLKTLNPTLAKEWNVLKNGELTPSDVTVSCNKKVWWICSICGREWQATVNSRNGRKCFGCPSCNNKNSANKRRLTHDSFISKFNETGNENIEIIGRYINSNTKIECRCIKCGNIWNANPYNLIKGNGCPKCSKNHKKTKAEVENSLKSCNPNVSMIGKYVNCHTKTKFKCNICGKEWETTPSNLLSGQGCNTCKRKAAGEKRRRAILQYEKDGTLIRRYTSALEAALDLGLSTSASIHSACQRNKKSAYGYIWKYEDDDYQLSKLVAANKGIRYSEGAKNRPKRVAQIDNGKIINIFESANEAGRAMGAVNGGNIIACCKGKHKKAYGFEWKYVEDCL